MNKFKRLITPTIFTLVLVLTSCQNDQTPVDPMNMTTFEQSGIHKITIPGGATIDSAKFFINNTYSNSEEVTLHRVTNFWGEMAVTWNNFGGSFDPTVEGSFIPMGAGWYSTDVTGLVNEWVNEIYPNFGILLKEASPDTFQTYSSKEGSDSPYLKVWYTLNGSSGYDSTDVFADSYIQSDSDDVNFGDAMQLVTGWQDTVDAQTLVNFEIEIVYTGCTRGMGYWKTHSAYGPAPYDDGWELLGEDSTFFLSSKTNYEVMLTPPSGGNAYYILAHHYIAAWLNILNGADPTEVQEAFEDATDLFETYTPQEIGNLQGNDPVRQEFISLKNMLASFNDGEIGPGNCGENNGEFPVKRK